MRKNYFLIVLAMVFTVNAMAQNIPSYVPTNGLVGYWPFNGNANDESGNNNNGTVNGATLSADRNGIANSAYSFDGVGNHITISKLATSLITNSYSVSFWILTSDTSLQYDGHEVIGDRDITTFDFKFRLNYGIKQQNFSQNTYLQTCTNSNSICSTINTPLPTISKWEHYFMTYDSNTNTFKAYKNGYLLQINENATFSAGNRQINIGRSVNPDYVNGNSYYKGMFDDLGIWDRALTEQEITALYIGCTSETATSSNFNSLLLSTSSSVSLSAEPQGGVFTGASIDSNKFVPSKAKIGANKVQYNFKNSQGCNDSTLFTMIVADTVGTTCKKYDTVIVTNNVTKYDTVTVTNNVTKYDTITVKNNIYDTVIVPKTITKYDTVKVNTYDTITVKNNIYDTVIVPKTVTKYDTITFTNTVTKYDTVIVNKTKYDTVIVPKTVTKYDTVKVNTYDTITVTNNVTKYDTVKVNTYDTITVTNNVTKYDTVIVPKTVTKYDTVKINTYDTITVTNSVNKYDTVIVNQTKYDTITVTDTVNILKINFKLTTGIKANQMTSMSIYPNPTSDVLIIDASDLAAITGYSYRILDALGKEVYNALVTAAKTEISLKTLGAKGMYVLHILDANKLSVQTKQIVLE